MFLLCCDMDRTLLPNGSQDYDNSMGTFSVMVEREKPMLAYVTGRRIEGVAEGIKEFNTPVPDYIIGQVGTRIYERKRDASGKIIEGGLGFAEDESWPSEIVSFAKNWDTNDFMQKISGIEGLRLQEKIEMNRFKLSYYVDDISRISEIAKKVRSAILQVTNDAEIVYSVNETNGMGFIDILPKHATKEGAVRHIQKKLGLGDDRTVFCGDSGNDILALTAGFRAILVKNAIDVVKEKVREIAGEKRISDRICVAQGYRDLNGNYVSGILEGLIRMGFIPESYAEGAKPQ